jgi:hypothetical protein
MSFVVQARVHAVAAVAPVVAVVKPLAQPVHALPFL